MQKLLTLLMLASALSACSHVTAPKSENAGMACIAPNVYVDHEMSAEQRQQFLVTFQQSKAEISRFFGGMESSPNIYACTTQKCFSKFGGVNAKAKSIDDNKVLLSSRGLDKVTLVHELAHIEFHKRLGYPHVWNKVPMWFDEGLAVLACKDPKYSKPVDMMSLNSLKSQDQWISAIRQNKPAYNVAKQAVESWYSQAGREGLENLIFRLKKGESFSLNDNISPNRQLTRL